MKRFGLLLLFLTLLLPSQVNAHGESEHIASFDSQITINKDNQAQIKETIIYDFGPNSRHGIERFVPAKTIAGDTGKFYFYEIDWGEIFQDGKPATVLEDNDDKIAYVRIGDADIEITGSHIYEINYTLSPIVAQDTGGDFINLNITGNKWAYPIENASATITLENESDVLSVRCYSGPTGSTAQDCEAKKDGAQATFGAKDLAGFEGLTINMLTEAGNFSTYSIAQDPPPPELRPFVSLAIGFLALIFGAVLRIISWFKYRARKKDQTIVPQYEPPKDLSVGEIGLLYDNSSDMKEITATLVDLAVRGHLKIEQTRTKSLFRQAEYTFHKLTGKDSLAEHESTLIDLLFKGTAKSVNLKDVDKTSAGSKVEKIKKAFVANLESKGFRHKNRQLSSQKTINKIFGFGGLIIVAWSLIFGIVALQTNLESGPIIFSTVVGLILLLVGLGISTRVEISDTGYAKWAEIQGLIMYLTVAEKDRLAFHDAPEKKPELFSALLPVAIALGVDKKWANQFKDLDMTENVDWYSGQGNLNSVLLANSLSHDFSNVVSSSFTTPTQSSSGFSGGGFSGGGGGGGGGGSW